jgi:hypothetical protein
LAKHAADLGKSTLEPNAVTVDDHQQSNSLLRAAPDIASSVLEARQDEGESAMRLASLDADATAEQPLQKRTKESLLLEILTQQGTSELARQA